MTPRAKSLTKWERRNLIIEDTLWRQIKEQARKEDRTASSLVRVALKEYIEKRSR